LSARRCSSCASALAAPLLDLGPQPPSNRFLGPGQSDEDRHPLLLGQCGACALVQLIDPMPAAMVKPRVAWLAYNEPESHLDALVSELCQVLPVDARVLGLTYKDDSTLERLRRHGFGRTRRLDAAGDLGIVDACAGLETIQSVLTPALAERLVERDGRSDVLIARHILEHTHDASSFLDACRRLVSPGGLLVFEVPDSERFLDAAEHCFLWEEHTSYFTRSTLRGHFERQQLSDIEVLSFTYPLEDSLVAVVRNQARPTSREAPPPSELERASRFAAEYPNSKHGWCSELERLRRSGRRLGIFGAGHLSAKFVNFYGLAELIECVVDDNPHKQGLCLPGSRLPIVGSAALSRGEVDECLLALSPESESRVRAARDDFLRAGGEFRSIFGGSRPSTPKAAESGGRA
jgi:hypothetical protein